MATAALSKTAGAKKRKNRPAQDATPASIGDALKDSLREAQRKPGAAAAVEAAAVAQETAAASTWETDETAPLPRGGGSALTPLEYRAVARRAKEDALFEVSGTAADDAGSEDGDADDARPAGSSRELVRAHVVSRKRLVAGVRLLCAVNDVSSDRLIVQMPNRLSGRIDREEVSDELRAALADGTLATPPDLRKLFQRGDVLCCAVLPQAARGSSATLATRDRASPPIELTLRLSVVQQAALAACPRLKGGSLVWAVLRSVEEYGFVMATGALGGGFLHRKTWHTSKEPLQWRPYLCAATTSTLQQARKPLQLAAVDGHEAPRALPQETALSFEALQPGMVMEAEVTGLLADGIKLRFGGYFEGTVSTEALGAIAQDWPRRFPPGTRVQARIVFVVPTDKAVGLCLADHLIRATTYVPSARIGAYLETAAQVVCRTGALLTAHSADADSEGAAEDAAEGAKRSQRSKGTTSGAISSPPAVAGWVSRGQITDLASHQKSEDALKRLKPGTQARGVVVGYRWLEGLLDVSTRPSEMKGERLRPEDVHVGQVRRGTVARIDAGRGIRIRLARGLYATCPASQLVEASLSRPLDKFSLGQSVRCVVLEAEPAREKLVVSLKSTLVETTLPRITEYSEASPGVTTHGVISHIKPKSIFITLLGGVRGVVRGSELRARFGALWESDPHSCYREGQVVECTVISCDLATRRLTLTLLSAEEAASKPAAKLLQRDGATNGAKRGSNVEGKDSIEPKKKRQKALEAEAAAEAETGARRLACLAEAKPGTHALASALSLADHGQLLCKLDVRGDVIGRVHLTERADPTVPAAIPTKLPTKPFEVVVLGKRDDEASSVRGAGRGWGGAAEMLELSIRPSELSAPAGTIPNSRLSVSDLTPGEWVEGWVRDATEDGVWVCISTRITGRVTPLEASDDPKVLTALSKHFSPGMPLKAQIISVNTDDQTKLKLDLSLRGRGHPLASTTVKGKKAKAKAKAAAEALATPTLPVVGAVLPVRIVRLREGRGLDVQLGHSMYARAHMTEICDDWVQEPLSTFEVGAYARALVLTSSAATSEGGGQIDVSLRSGAIASASSSSVKSDPHKRVDSGSEVEEGQLVRGYVKAISARGCFVALSRLVDGFVGLKHLSDEFIKADQLSELLPIGTLVVARVLQMPKGRSGALPLSLRRSDVDGGAFAPPAVTLTFDDVQSGMILPGKVKSVTDFGVFVRLDGSMLDALCHSSQVSDKRVGRLADAFVPGVPVKVAILRTNSEKRQISASMKRSQLEAAGWEEDEEEANRAAASDGAKRPRASQGERIGDSVDDDSAEGDEGADEAVTDGESEDDDGEGEDDGEDDDADMDDSDGDPEDVHEEEESSSDGDAGTSADDGADDDGYQDDALATLGTDVGDAGGLSRSAGLLGSFVWDDFGRSAASANDAARSDSAAVAAAAAAAGAAPSRRGKKVRDREAERDAESATALREEAMANADGAPRSAEDYERLLIGAPNSSYTWMRYMAYTLGLTEIERAREIGERALRTIELGEHGERFNIWAALINLEKAHGDDESLAAAISRALHGADPKAVYTHVAAMHERANDAELADSAFETAAKKYRQHTDVWLAWIGALMARGEQPSAKAVLQRAVDALPRAKHVEVISKFAQLEFRHGSAERGRTVFDGVLANYPKRVDIWSVYMDMELREGQSEPTRRLFERATSLRLSSKKMKYFFSRYLTYARSASDSELVAQVKAKARAYVESVAGGSEGE